MIRLVQALIILTALGVALPACADTPTSATVMTLAEIDTVQHQLEQCWNVPIGGPNAWSLIVKVGVNVNANGTITNANIIDKQRYDSDSYFHAAGDAVLRAVHNPKCNTLTLPPEKYEQWKHLELTFDPRDML